MKKIILLFKSISIFHTRELITLFIFFLSPFYGFSQAVAPKYSNEFLSIGVGAKAFGMANSQVASVNDVTSGYWNPAGLVGITSKYQVSIMHSEYFGGIANYDYLGFTTPVDSNSHIAISAIRFAVDDIPDTRFIYDANGQINYDNIQFFSAADYAFLLSYARSPKFLKNLALGANFKVIYRSVGDFANAWGFGLDAGAQYKFKKWSLGLMLRDVTGTFNAWTHNTDLVRETYLQTGNDLPVNSVEVTLPKAILGVNKSFNIKDKFGINIEVDFDITFDGKRNVPIKSDIASIDPHTGLELDYKKTIFLRLGAGNWQKIKDFDNSTYNSFQPNFGVGLKLKKVFIDYALTDIGNQSESLYSHVFSIKAELNGK